MSGRTARGADLNMFSQSAAEERVKMFDRIAPQLISDQEKTQSERAFAVALVAFSCRPGMSHQSSLLAPYIPLLPEAAIWLGAMQASNPVTETLAIGDGLGWRLAREIFDGNDVFSAPHCDIAFSELRVLSRGRSTSRMIKSVGNSRMDVELLPGVSAWVRIVPADAPVQPSLPIETPSTSDGQPKRMNSPPVAEALAEAERSIETGLRILRGMRTDRDPGRVKRKRGR